jgi:hypothetical protein
MIELISGGCVPRLGNGLPVLGGSVHKERLDGLREHYPLIKE